jgi:hypothetical protein
MRFKKLVTIANAMLILGGVNAQLVNYQTPFNSATINALPNTTLPVGAIAGADVSGNGAASYTIPIAVPKGAKQQTII